jgi:hypothetical protein
VTGKAVAREAPTRWAIAGILAAGGSDTITYTLGTTPDGTHFHRTFVHAMPNWFGLLDWLFIRRRIAAESAEAVRHLKHAVEFS